MDKVRLKIHYTLLKEVSVVSLNIPYLRVAKPLKGFKPIKIVILKMEVINIKYPPSPLFLYRPKGGYTF